MCLFIQSLIIIEPSVFFCLLKRLLREPWQTHILPSALPYAQPYESKYCTCRTAAMKFQVEYWAPLRLSY